MMRSSTKAIYKSSQEEQTPLLKYGKTTQFSKNLRIKRQSCKEYRMSRSSATLSGTKTLLRQRSWRLS